MKHDWEYKKLGEVASLVADGDWIESKDQSEDGIRLIQTGNIGNGVFKSKDDKPHYISEETFNRLGCTEIFEGDCLVSRLPDPVGRACIIPNTDSRMITAVDCSIIRFDKSYLPKTFVYYSRSSKYATLISNNTTGSTRKRISRKNLETIPIPIPPLPIQQQIVAELDKVSEIIEKKKKQVKELDNLAQSIFYDMFGDPVENEKGWEVKKYGEVFIIGAGGTPSKSKPEYWEGGNIPWIGSNMCQNQIIYQTDGKYITDEGLSHSSAKVLEEGTVLVALVGATIGKVGLLKTKTATNQNIAFVKVGENLGYNPYFVYYQLQSLYGLFMSIGNGDFKMANQGFIKDLPIITPPLPLQQTFAQKVEAIERQKELITASIKEAQLLFDARMDYWFGE